MFTQRKHTFQCLSSIYTDLLLLNLYNHHTFKLLICELESTNTQFQSIYIYKSVQTHIALQTCIYAQYKFVNAQFFMLRYTKRE